MNFDCPRTCELKERCRFMKVLATIGPTVVFSHTVKVRVEFRDDMALKAAVLAMGGTWLGQGKHDLYEGSVRGLGWQFKGWQYPCCVNDGELSYDTFSGAWGREEDIERLKAEYSCSKAEVAAHALGWLTERTAEGVVIHSPEGGTITINGASADFSGFQGNACHEARAALGITGDVELKPQASHVAAEVQVSE